MARSKTSNFLRLLTIAMLFCGTLVGIFVVAVRAQRDASRLHSPFEGFDSFGSVVDERNRPISHCTLLFRDHTGGEVMHSLTTDARGFFRTNGLDKFDMLPVDGFSLASREFSSGAGMFYVFAPLGQQAVELRDRDGHLLPGIELVQHDARSTNPMGEITTDAYGAARLPDTNVLRRYTFHGSLKSAYGVYQTTAEVHGKNVLYHVRAEKNGSVTGSVQYQSGAPLRGYYAYAVPTDTPFLPWNSQHMAVTGPQGRFRLEGLLPGRYNIGVESPHRPRDAKSPIRETIHVQSDVTTNLPKLTVPGSWSVY